MLSLLKTVSAKSAVSRPLLSTASVLIPRNYSAAGLDGKNAVPTTDLSLDFEAELECDKFFNETVSFKEYNQCNSHLTSRSVQDVSKLASQETTHHDIHPY